MGLILYQFQNRISLRNSDSVLFGCFFLSRIMKNEARGPVSLLRSGYWFIIFRKALFHEDFS